MNLSHPGVKMIHHVVKRLRSFIEFVSQSLTNGLNIWVLLYLAFVAQSMPLSTYWYSCFMYDRNFFQ